ncbi:MAG TPA: TlpA disulfide reductase family protein [Polymorphobacter sp.]|nr:TlpA disulfide reductase family protein [Polymorphobacter sp.]
MRVVIATLLLTVSLHACGSKTPATDGNADTAKAGTPQASAAANVAVDRSHAGTPAPTFGFEARGGAVKHMADFGGQPVLVNLWASWCAPCVAELPALNALASAKAGQLTVLAISQDMEGWKAVDKRFKPDAFSTLNPYLDQPGNYALALGAKGLPVSILYDAEGKEIWRVARPLEWNSPEVRALLP